MDIDELENHHNINSNFWKTIFDTRLKKKMTCMLLQQSIYSVGSYV